MAQMCCLPWCRRPINNKRKCKNFPSDRPTQLAWLDALEMGAWFSIPPETLSSSLLVCGNHFDRGNIKPRYEVPLQTPPSPPPAPFIKREPQEISGCSESQSEAEGSDEEDEDVYNPPTPTNVRTSSGKHKSTCDSASQTKVNIVKVEGENGRPGPKSKKRRRATSSKQNSKSNPLSSSSETEAVSAEAVLSNENDECCTDFWNGMVLPDNYDQLTTKVSEGKQSRTALNLMQKMEIIRMADEGVKQVEIARKLNLKRSTVWGAIQSRDKIEKAFNSGAPLRKKLRKGTFDDVNEALYSWYQTVSSQNVYVNTRVIMTMAENIANQLGRADFKGSQGWLERFKQRYNIKFNSNPPPKPKKVVTASPSTSSAVMGSGEDTYNDYNILDGLSATNGEDQEEDSEVDDDSVLTSKDWIKYNWSKFRVKDHKTQELYHEKDIFFAKEVGVLYRITPKAAFQFRTNASAVSEFSIAEERIMVLLCANGDGSEKRKLLLVGGVHLTLTNNLPVEYIVTPDPVNGLTKPIFANWLKAWNNELHSQNRKIVLLLDSSPLHIFNEHLPCIKFVNIPTHHLARLHPVNLGISTNFRTRYKRLLLRKLVTNGGVNISCSDAAFLLNTAWNEVPNSLVKNAYERGLVSCNGKLKHPDQDEFDCSDLMSKAAELGLAVPLSKYSFKNYVEIDNSLCAIGCTILRTEPVPKPNESDGEILHQAFAEISDDVSEMNDDFMQQIEFVPTQSTLSSEEAYKRLDDLRKWAMANNSCPQEVHNALSTIESFILGHD